MSGPRLRFCKESNDLLYPREDKERKRLVYYCKNCSYTEDAEEADWCVYRNAVKEVKDKTVITQVTSPSGKMDCVCSDNFHAHFPHRVGSACLLVLLAVVHVCKAACLNFPKLAQLIVCALTVGCCATQDVRFNPTLPRTKDVQCPACNHNESVYYTSATSTGMTLHFQCTDCGHKWLDSV